VEKYGTAKQAKDDTTLCMLDNKYYKRTFGIYNTNCFSAVTMVAETRLIVTFIIRTLPVLF
jgi:hypothetical protein